MRYFLMTAMIFLVACEADPGEQETQQAARLPTIAKNVLILEKKLTIPGLNRARQIRIYLPPDYEQSNQNYPVLYMHDGQNLFDDVTSYNGEWQVDEVLNSLHSSRDLGLIVVGIDNSPERRLNEYSPWTNPDYGSAEGDEYVDFVVKVLKPYIDQHYRTIASVDSTAIMGSSMGGLISIYAILKYPNIFSKAGVYSPSFWFSEQVFEYTEQQLGLLTNDHQIHMLVGVKEGDEMVNGVKRMEQLILSKRTPNLQLMTVIDPEGEHNEAFWASHFMTTMDMFFPAKTVVKQ